MLIQIKQLENELEEEKQQLQKIIKENKCKNVKLQPIVFSDQDELDNLTKEIIKLEVRSSLHLTFYFHLNISATF